METQVLKAEEERRERCPGPKGDGLTSAEFLRKD